MGQGQHDRRQWDDAQLFRGITEQFVQFLGRCRGQCVKYKVAMIGIQFGRRSPQLTRPYRLPDDVRNLP
ncbi:MAG: hypothetical protein Q7U38_15785, partial [Methylobacter sp.]|nr:hypothetical protein [Methylobacter sp.]